MKIKITKFLIWTLVILLFICPTVVCSNGNITSINSQEKIMMWCINGPSTPLNTSNSIVSLNLLNPSAVVLNNVPTSTWTYGCIATSAGMLFGYYDRIGYSNMYTGPDNGGVCPLTDLGQGTRGTPGYPVPGSCYIIATEKGLDGIASKGHVDDYWIVINSPGPDPWETNPPEHPWSLCVADFLGTNQWKWDTNLDGNKDVNYDGGTLYYTNHDGSKLYDYMPPASHGLPQTETGHGCKLFAQSRGYTVTTVYNQLTNTPQGSPNGFTFSDFQAEINAGRPVLTHWISSTYGGHTMLGVGYDAPTNTIYLHDTWDNNLHQCAWNGAYSGYNFELKAVTVIQLAPLGNSPPVYGTPSPADGSTGNLLSLSWSIPINDPDGDSFNWVIQCSNGQSANANGASNGTKSLSLSGLAYLTLYKVWVNATDPSGSGLWTRSWFTFTTQGSGGNNPPVFGIPSPADGSTGNLLSLSWSIPINDPDGDSFNWIIQCSNGQSANANGASNGTKSVSLSGLASLTTYKVWVNATDPTGSGQWTRRWYTFTTKQGNANNPPLFGMPSPMNGSTGNPLSLNWSIPINDPEGNLFYWRIECNNGQVNNGIGPPNGTLMLYSLAYSTTYKVWVNATDPSSYGGSGLYTRKWYTFTTESQQNEPPNKPDKPSGITSGKINVLYNYTTSTTDPDGDQVYYMWDWGDGNTSGWLGPFNSGVSIFAPHIWNVKGDYSIKVKAKDTSGAESPWSDPLPITMPYSYTNPIIQFLELLFQRFPHAFPILKQLLGY